MLKKLWRLREFYGDRIAWKFGDLTGEESPRHYGQFGVGFDINVDSHTFYNPRTDTYPLDHSFYAMAWRWGVWVALRGKEA